MSVYLYGLRDPRHEGLRYIGKAKEPRARLSVHISDAKKGRGNPRVGAWIRELLAQDVRPEMVVLAEVAEDQGRGRPTLRRACGTGLLHTHYHAACLWHSRRRRAAITEKEDPTS